MNLFLALQTGNKEALEILKQYKCFPSPIKIDEKKKKFTRVKPEMVDRGNAIHSIGDKTFQLQNSTKEFQSLMKRTSQKKSTLFS